VQKFSDASGALNEGKVLRWGALIPVGWGVWVCFSSFALVVPALLLSSLCSSLAHSLGSSLCSSCTLLSLSARSPAVHRSRRLDLGRVQTR
jgi:hypothetical protein